MLIKKTLIEKKITKITLAESGFKPILAQAIPFKLSYADISRHSKNTVDSTSHYEIYVVIAGNRDGKPVIATMTTTILAKQNYNDLNLVLQALAKPIE